MHGGAALSRSLPSPRGPFAPSARARRAARVQARTLQQHPAAARAGGGACVAAIPYHANGVLCAAAARAGVAPQPGGRLLHGGVREHRSASPLAIAPPFHWPSLLLSIGHHPSFPLAITPPSYCALAHEGGSCMEARVTIAPSFLLTITPSFLLPITAPFAVGLAPV